MTLHLLIKGGGTVFVKSNQTRRCTRTAASKLPISTEINAKDNKKRYDDHSTMKYGSHNPNPQEYKENVKIFFLPSSS